MRKTTSIIITILVLVLIIFGASWLNEHATSVAPADDVSTGPSPITITESTITEANFGGTRPVITGDGAVAIVASGYVDQAIAMFKASADQEVPDLRAKFGNNAPPSHYTIDLHAEHVLGSKTESIVIDSYVYTGGANGNSTYKVFTVRRSDDMMLVLSDIVPAEMQAAFTDMVKKRLLTPPGDGTGLSVFPEDVKNLTFASFDNFSLDDTALTLYFDKYEIGPGALGAVTLALPFADIQQYLNI